MVQDGGFKHISVTAPEEEDEVVFAGAGPEAGAGAAVPGDVPEPAAAQADAGASGAGQPATGEAGRLPGAGGEAADRRGAADRAARQGARDDGPTLDDLDAGRMPLTQIVVIVAAIVCIIGAIVYCAAFMG